MSGVSYSPDYEAPKPRKPTTDEGLIAAANAVMPWRKRVDDLERALAAAADECAKWRTAASVLCGAHIGVPQERCPVCEFLDLRSENAQLRAEAEALRRRLDFDPQFVELREERNRLRAKLQRIREWAVDRESDSLLAILGPPESRPAEEGTNAD